MVDMSTVASIDIFEKTLESEFAMAKGCIMAAYISAQATGDKEYISAVTAIGKDKVARFVADIMDETPKMAVKYILGKE